MAPLRFQVMHFRGPSVDGREAVSERFWLRLSRFFGMSERFWLNLQVRYDLEVAKDRIAGLLEKQVRRFAETAVSTV
jgi:plasmid maintenance system antidote protein VapI